VVFALRRRRLVVLFAILSDMAKIFLTFGSLQDIGWKPSIIYAMFLKRRLHMVSAFMRYAYFGYTTGGKFAVAGQ
jgi:hypothetical protein